jgi:plastocyanin
MTKAIALLAVLAAAAVGLVACGSDSGTTTSSSPAASAPSGGSGGGGGGGAGGGGGTSSGGGQSSPLTVTANPQGQLTWTPTTLNAKAGKVTITLQNSSPVSHDVSISGNGVSETSDLVSGGSASVTANLKPGTYTYFCTVPGHEQAGMKGTLTVK